MIELKLPLLGDVMQEGTLVAWLLPDGSRVDKGQPLYRLETDKVSLDVESPESGVLEQLASAGSTVPVGAVVGRLRQEAPLLASGEAELARERGNPSHAAQAAGDARSAEAALPEVGDSGRAAAIAGGPGGRSTPWEAPSAGARATPAARRLAKELGVSLEDVQPTGERIHEADVRAAHAALGTTRLTGRRAVIADRMVASLREMAQLTISMEVDVTAAAALRDQLAQLWEQRPTYTDLVLAAAARALREHPALNATLEQGALKRHERIAIGLAVDASEGLIVPVIRNVDQLDLADLVAESRRLSDQARSNTLTLDHLHAGTFSVTSLGALGIDFFTPIINPPQVAILGIGRAFSKLALINGSVQERQALYLSLSFDHRAVDGAPAARFLNRVKMLLELPAGLLTPQGMKLPPLTSSTAPTQ